MELINHKSDEDRKLEIKAILDCIEEIWQRYPYLRLYQLLGDCFPGGDNYFIDDPELHQKLCETYPLKREKI